MNELRKILALVLVLVMVMSILPANASVAAAADEVVDNSQTQTETNAPAEESAEQEAQDVVVTLTVDDARLHKSKAVNLSADAAKMSITRSDLWYDYNSRKVIPSVYNLREVMTDKVGTSSDTGINRYPYVVTKVNVAEAGYYDLGVIIEMNSAAAVNAMAIIVDGTLHIVHPKIKSGKQQVVAENVYLTAGEHSVFYTSVLPQNESEFELGKDRATFDTYYPWTDFYAFTYAGAADCVEILDASALTGADVQSILKESTRVEAEDSYRITWNGYSTVESKGAASGDTMVGGPAYSQIKQTFAQIAADGLDKAKVPCMQLAVDAPAAGTYYLTIGANIGTSTNNDNPVPFVAVIANGNAPIKAQFDGAWNGMDAVTVAVQLEKGSNVIYCTTVTPDQYSTGTAWVNYDFIELQKGLTVLRANVSAEAEDWADYLYLNKYADCETKFADPGSNTIYPDMKWDFPSLYEDMYGIYADSKPARAGYWPYIALRVNADKAGEYRISAKIKTDASAKTIGMIVDGALYTVDVTTTSGLLTQSAYLSQGEHVVIFTSPIPQDMSLIEAKNDPMYPWMDFLAFELDDGLSFAEAPTAEAIQASMQTYSGIEAEDGFAVSANGHYIANASKSYVRRYFNPYIATIKGAADALIDGVATSYEKLVNTTQTFAEIKAGKLDKNLTSYVQYTVNAEAAGTYVIRIGAYLEGSGDMPYGTVLVNGAAYKAQFGGNWNGYYAANVAVELKAGLNTIRLIGVTADQTGTDGWIGYDFVDVPAGVALAESRNTVSAADEDWASYLYLNRYTDSGSNFGGPNYNDMKWEFPTLYGPLYGIYSDTLPNKADRWPYVAMRVNAEADGYYSISTKIETSAATYVGIVVDNAVYMADVVSKTATKTVYLTAGEHVIVFLPTIPQDMTLLSAQTNSLYPWVNFVDFKLGAGVSFLAAPTIEQIQEASRTYSRVEAEDSVYANANGGYAANISKGYTVKYFTNYTNTVKGAAGAAIDGTVTADEKLVNSAQTYADIQAGNLDKDLTSYVQYVVEAPEAGNYAIRVGAYLEGTGTMPYGTVLVNGVAYKAQFGGNWNGYYVVTLGVQLNKGKNSIQLVGITADQTATDGWIGYDFVEITQDVSAVAMTVSAADENWADYLYLNLYADVGSKFGDPGSNTIYPDMKWDFPTLYEAMYGIYSDAKPARAGKWPYIAFKVHAPKAGEYQISVKIGTKDTAKTIGMIVDGAMYVVDVTTTSGVLTKSAYLTAGEHVILFTSPIPQDMTLIEAQNDAMYPWFDFNAFTLNDGLTFAGAPDAEAIQASMQNYSRVEAEDLSYVSANGNYAADISKDYVRRYFSPYTVTVKGAAGAVIDGTAAAEEMLVNTTQTYAQLAEVGLDKALTSYVQYTLEAEQAGTYVIRIGAYLEGSGDMPYGTVLVNGVAYKAQFGGNWNGYYAANVAVQLQKGENTVRLIGITADQTAVSGWIGYDFVDLPDGVTTAGGRKEVSAADDDWADYVYLNSYVDNGNNFGGAYYADFKYDYPSLYEEMLGIYSDAKPDRAGYWPYVALRVNAEAAGYYTISATIETVAAETVGMIVDGTTYAVDVVDKKVTQSVYLNAGAHIVIFTVPMPRDMTVATSADNALYPWINYCSFKLPAGLSFGEAPSFEAIKNSMQSYSKMEAEDPSGVTATGGYIFKTSNTYTRRYGDHTVIVKGWNGLVRSTDYIEYKVYAQEAGTYVIRIGAYLEGSGDMPYGTVLVNGVSYKAQFGGNWSGYDAVNLPVQLQKGENTVQLYGVSADQTATSGWIGYDFVEVPEGLYFDEPGEYSADHVDKGFTFEKRVTYETSGAISQAPYTMSAWIYLPSGYVARGGVIFGNYVDYTIPCTNFEIAENGVPRFYHVNGAGEVVDLKFENVNVCADIWTNVTFTISGNNVSCYKNGVLIDTLTAESNIDLAASQGAYALGGDLRLSAEVGSPNNHYFKGRILDVALFDKALSDTEAQAAYADAEACAPYTRYKLENTQIGKDVADEKGNNDLSVKTPYFDKAPVTDYAYSFAVVGDTQIVVENDVNNGENNLSKLYDWILENRTSKNIQYVFGLGDITDNDVEAEWAAAQVQMQKLDQAGIAYSLVRGNHDMRNETDLMTQYLGSEAYKSQFANGGFYDESISNSWRTFSVGEVDYLMLTLDYAPSAGLLAWAGEVVEAHPNHSVIITTHSYLYRDETILEQQSIWNNLVSKYENILLVLSGHYPSDTIVTSQTQGVNGNTVTSILVNPQHVDLQEGSTGMLAMLYFSEDGREVQVEYLSTVKAAENKPAYFREDNQFSLELFEEVLPDGLVATENGYRLVKNVTVDELTVKAGKTLDLNGYALGVNSLVSFGSIVDTSEGNTGKLIAANVLFSDMAYMPIYDSANGWYKFYAYELVSLGVRSGNDSAVYGFSIAFENADAYALLASSGNAGLDVVMTLSWGDEAKSFAFDAALLQQYAELQVKYPALRAALMLKVTGLDALESGTTLTVTPAVNAGQVSVTGEEMVYTIA